MNTEQLSDRIKLAEAMGWTHIHMKYVAMDETSYPFGCVPGNVNDKHLKEQIPDPYTNANDDYAVLEWMRERRDSLLADDADVWRKFMAVIHEGAFCTSLYQIGDYARAALKVIP